MKTPKLNFVSRFAHRLGVLAVSTGLLLTGTGAAVANDDSHIYHGENCVAHGNATPWSYGYYFYNSSYTQSMSVTCPVPRQANRRQVDQGWVRFIDDNQSERASCELWSVYIPHRGPGWSNYITIHGRLLSRNGVNTESFVGDLTHRSGTSSMIYKCTLPPRTGIASYMVDQK